MLPKKNDQKKLATPQKMLPPKKEKMLPQKCWRTLLRGGLLLNFGKMAYFIAYGFIKAIRTLGSHPVLSVCLMSTPEVKWQHPKTKQQRVVE